MKIRFLLDENLTPRLKAALKRYDAAIDVLRVGDANAPPLGTEDADLLLYLEASQRLFITDNRASIPGHIDDHFKAGGHHWGVFWIRPGFSIGALAEFFHLLWDASEAREWIDQAEWAPF